MSRQRVREHVLVQTGRSFDSDIALQSGVLQVLLDSAGDVDQGPSRDVAYARFSNRQPEQQPAGRR